ncbi:MAG: Mrp/NBP35 family ATP-binding protein [Deltaproteobacteria bacterium]|nr:Mrp/NBP35 family ATP-binding protein [Deltaproteobacteria bacterium]
MNQPITKEHILSALEKVKSPLSLHSILEGQYLKNVSVCDNIAKLNFELHPHEQGIQKSLESQINTALTPLGLKEYKVEFSILDGKHPPAVAASVESHMKSVIAVASGKGGVGKSTVAANLAVALAKLGFQTGLLDADIYGPSIPLLMKKVGSQPLATPQGKIVPLENYGLKLMSVGFVTEPGQAIVWRGPMIHKLLEEFFKKVEWGDLDYLVIDLPPGTGDTQLSLSQLIPLSGAVIVTTPQDVALADVEKCVKMFEKVHIPILGIVENMSYYLCSRCGERDEIFSHGGGQKAAEKWGYHYLGAIPLKTQIREGGDSGLPFVEQNLNSQESQAILEIAKQLKDRVKPVEKIHIHKT